jgi:hypothetical protein
MRSLREVAWDSLLPLGVFAATVVVHVFWTGSLPEPAAVQSQWASLPVDEQSRWSGYLEAGNLWLGYSYGISFAFAAVALRRYLRARSSAAGRFALGGTTFSGLLAFLGCYLTGCCGSPMLLVYLNLFGAGFLPFAKPFIAALTTVSILGAWWWMGRTERKREVCCSPGHGACL